MKNLICSFFEDETAATAIEYGLIAAGISVAIIAVVQGLGSKLNTVFTSVSTALKKASWKCSRWLRPLAEPLLRRFKTDAPRAGDEIVLEQSRVPPPAYPLTRNCDRVSRVHIKQADTTCSRQHTAQMQFAIAIGRFSTAPSCRTFGTNKCQAQTNVSPMRQSLPRISLARSTTSWDAS